MRIHRNIQTLILTHFLWGFVNFTYTIQIQPYLIHIFGSTPQAAEVIGIILSIGSFSAVFPLIFAFIAEKWGRSRMIILGQTISILGLLGLAYFSQSIIVAFIGIILFNIGIGLYDPPLQGLIFESATKKRGSSYSLVYNSASISGIISSFIIQGIGNQGIILLFQLGCGILFLSFFMNLLLLRDEFQNTRIFQFPLTKLMYNPLAKFIALIFFLDSLIWGLPMSIENSVIIILFGVGSEYLGLIFFVQMIIIVILQYPVGILVDKFGKVFGLIVGELTGLLWILFFALALINPEEFFFLILFAHSMLGISVAFWRPSVTLSFVTIEDSMATSNFGILSFIQRIGWVPTAAIGGFLFANFGYSIILTLTFFGTFVLVFLFLKAYSLENKKKQ